MKIRILVPLASFYLLYGCSLVDNKPVQRQIKVISSYTSRWCADRQSETVDGCNYSNDLSRLGGLVGALGGGSPSPVFQVDSNDAFLACKKQLPDSIYDSELNSLLSKGLLVVHQSQNRDSEWARLADTKNDQGYFLIECSYTLTLVEGPSKIVNDL